MVPKKYRTSKSIACFSNGNNVSHQVRRLKNLSILEKRYDLLKSSYGQGQFCSTLGRKKYLRTLGYCSNPNRHHSDVNDCLQESKVKNNFYHSILFKGFIAGTLIVSSLFLAGKANASPTNSRRLALQAPPAAGCVRVYEENSAGTQRKHSSIDTGGFGNSGYAQAIYGRPSEMMQRFDRAALRNGSEMMQRLNQAALRNWTHHYVKTEPFLSQTASDFARFETENPNPRNDVVTLIPDNKDFRNFSKEVFDNKSTKTLGNPQTQNLPHLQNPQTQNLPHLQNPQIVSQMTTNNSQISRRTEKPFLPRSANYFKALSERINFSKSLSITIDGTKYLTFKDATKTLKLDSLQKEKLKFFILLTNQTNFSLIDFQIFTKNHQYSDALPISIEGQTCANFFQVECYLRSTGRSLTSNTVKNIVMQMGNKLTLNEIDRVWSPRFIELTIDGVYCASKKDAEELLGLSNSRCQPILDLALKEYGNELSSDQIIQVLQKTGNINYKNFINEILIYQKKPKTIDSEGTLYLKSSPILCDKDLFSAYQQTQIQKHTTAKMAFLYRSPEYFQDLYNRRRENKCEGLKTLSLTIDNTTYRTLKEAALYLNSTPNKVHIFKELKQTKNFSLQEFKNFWERKFYQPEKSIFIGDHSFNSINDVQKYLSSTGRTVNKDVISDTLNLVGNSLTVDQIDILWFPKSTIYVLEEKLFENFQEGEQFLGLTNIKPHTIQLALEKYGNILTADHILEILCDREEQRNFSLRTIKQDIQTVLKYLKSKNPKS